MRWFRFYDEALNDPKVQRLSAPLFRVWVNLLCLASKFGGRLPELYDIAFALRIPEPQAAKALGELVDHGLIDATDQGHEPHNWHSRQYASDSAAERMKRHRDKKRDVTVTPQTTETEQITEKKRAPEAPTIRDELIRVLDSERADGVIDHRKRIRKPLSLRAAKLLAAEFAKCPDPNIAADQMVARGWTGFDPTWLKNKNGHDPPSTSGPPAGFREAKSTGEYIAYMREKTGDPKLENGDWRLSKWQHVPKDWTANVIAMKRGAG